MDHKFQTSFIPKSPAAVYDPAPKAKTGYSVNVFNLVATFVFIVTAIVWGGAFIYKNIVISQIKSINKEISDKGAVLKSDEYKKLIETSERFAAVKKIINQHGAVSELLTLVQELTLKKVRFNNFIYSNKDKNVTLSMATEAQTYNALAQQLAVFKESKYLRNPTFTVFSPGQNGNITASFITGVEPGLVLYSRAVGDTPN